MSLQNRVDPFGEIHAVPERGTLFGNRGGCFHDSQQQLRGSHWVSRRWITCLLRYKGWHREVMTPNRYTELFFLDEATAFAAGHRPVHALPAHRCRPFHRRLVTGAMEAHVARYPLQ